MLDFHKHRRTLSALLSAFGLVLIALAFSADLLVGGRQAVGPRQLLLAALGLIVLIQGLVFRFVKTRPPASPATVRPVSLPVLAAWFGLITALIEVAALFIYKYTRNRFLQLSPDFVWMGPLVNLVLFGIAGAVLLILSRRWPRFGTTRVVCGVSAFLSFVALLWMIPQLYMPAALLVAAGLAVQSSRVIAYDERIHLLVRRTVVWLIAAIPVAGFALWGWNALAERQALAKLPDARPGAPNVLLIVLDTVRAKSLSLYGYDRPTTPNLEKLAARSIVFDNAIATSPWTLPTHASLMTGLFHHQMSVNWFSPLDSRTPTLAEALGANGYTTAGFVANHNYTGYESGIQRGFAHYEDYEIRLGQALLSSSFGRAFSGIGTWRRLVGWHENFNRKSAENVNADFLDWLSHKGERPFFVFLNYLDAHQPYLPPEPFDLMFGPDGPRARYRYRLNLTEIDSWKSLSPQQIQAERDAYDGSITYLDEQIGRLLNELERRGQLDNTLVIVTSDHGEQFGEHGLGSHGNSLYLPLLRVPLLMSLPSCIPMNRRVSAPVTLRDVPATVADCLALPGESRFSGNSLARHWSRENQPGDAAESPLLSEVTVVGGKNVGWMRSLIADGHHYIRSSAGEEGLYDLLKDPDELNNLAKTEAGGARLDRFRSLLQTAITPRSTAQNITSQ